MAACLKDHMARHLGAKKLRDLGNLQTIFAGAANQNDATKNPAVKQKLKVDCCVVTP